MLRHCLSPGGTEPYRLSAHRDDDIVVTLKYWTLEDTNTGRYEHVNNGHHHDHPLDSIERTEICEILRSMESDDKISFGII